jgi:putative flippase GtrA
LTLLDHAAPPVRPAAAAAPPADRRAAIPSSSLGPALSARVRQWLRYASVSVVSTAVGMTVLGALVTTRLVTPGWANVVATGVGTVPSFELNRRWVWGRSGRRSVAREIGPFAALSFVGLLVSTVAVSAAGHLAAGLGTFDRTALIEAANVGAFGSLWVVQFLVCDRLLFAHRAPGVPATVAATAGGGGGSQGIPAGG